MIATIVMVMEDGVEAYANAILDGVEIIVLFQKYVMTGTAFHAQNQSVLVVQPKTVPFVMKADINGLKHIIGMGLLNALPALMVFLIEKIILKNLVANVDWGLIGEIHITKAIIIAQIHPPILESVRFVLVALERGLKAVMEIVCLARSPMVYTQQLMSAPNVMIQAHLELC